MGCTFTIPEASLGIVEQWGRFDTVKPPGIHLINPCFGSSLAGKISLRIQESDVRCETKTLDNVFVTVCVSIQFSVIREHAYEAYYKLSNPRQQINAYVSGVVRSTVPRIKLDNVFETKDHIADAVKEELSKTMSAFGYAIVSALVVDIVPDPRVKAAMNEINAAQRMRVAATDKAEAEKIITVKAAEAEAESKFLAGCGIARQRKAIVDGLRESVVAFSGSVPGATAKDVMDLVLVTQYFDTLKEIGSHGKSNTVFIPHSPSSFVESAAPTGEVPAVNNSNSNAIQWNGYLQAAQNAVAQNTLQ